MWGMVRPVGFLPSMTAAQMSVAFFLQMFCILAACRLVGALARRLGQPQVVGEMIAGVFLGPSLLGFLFPEIQGHLFPKESLKVLYVGAQLGVGLYMFLVGVEFNVESFLNRARSALSVSVAGMVAPFILGGLLTLWLFKLPGLFSEKASLTTPIPSSSLVSCSLRTLRMSSIFCRSFSE